MKRLLILLLFTSSSLFTGIPHSKAAGVAASGDNQIEQAASENQPYYLYQGKRIPLQVRNDAVAVAFKPQASTRGDAQPQYLQLQAALNSGTRSSTTTEISPLGQRYAIATLPPGTRNTDNLQSRIAQQSFVETTLPVLTSPGQSETLILNNELILRFTPSLSEAEQQRILQRNNLEILRAMPFTRGSIVVRTVDFTGLDTLALANELAMTDGVESVSPNFIQQISLRPAPPAPDSRSLPSSSLPSLNQSSGQPRSELTQPASQFLPFQWHINSVPLLSCLGQSFDSPRSFVACIAQPKIDRDTVDAPARTDLRVSEVWKQGQQGEGVVVAVLDDLIQWDHPALRDSLYRVSHPDRCETEVHGWDFSSMLDQPAAESTPGDLNAEFDFCELGDAETRMEADEFGYLKALLDDAFLLSDEELLQRYPADAQERRAAGEDEAEIAQALRQELQGDVTYEFHGTAVSSVVAARSSQMLGVAPQAKILPVRFVGLNLSLSVETYALGIRYAADRGADIINISYGLGFPTDEGTHAIREVLEENPDLVIVSASGNANRDRISRPAVLPEVLSVGASNHSGQRAPYSNFGPALDLVAPGGDTSKLNIGGLILAGGTWYPEFWSGLPEEASLSGDVLDRKGSYYFGNGTSFAAPAVTGVLALMKAEDPQRRFSWTELTEILKETARLDRLSLSEPERTAYERWAQNSNGELPASEAAAKAYFLGAGLVDAEAAVREVQRRLSLSESR